MVSHPDRSSSAEQEQEQNWANDDWRGTGTARIIGVFWYTLQLELPDLGRIDGRDWPSEAMHTDTAHFLITTFFSRLHRHTQVPVYNIMLEHRTSLSPCLNWACFLGDIPASI